LDIGYVRYGAEMEFQPLPVLWEKREDDKGNVKFEFANLQWHLFIFSNYICMDLWFMNIVVIIN